MKNIFNFIKKDEKAIVPKRSTAGSAGFDLSACIDEAITIRPHDTVIIPTGIAISINDTSIAGFVFGRSGLGIKHGITLSNSVGVIDSDYTGEIKVGLCNVSSQEYTIKSGDRIAQIVFMPICMCELVQVDELPKTTRGEKGLGSTGK